MTNWNPPSMFGDPAKQPEPEPTKPAPVGTPARVPAPEPVPVVSTTREPAPERAAPRVGIHHADCLDFLRTVPNDTFTAIVTDPPYGLEFMGKDWDKALPDPRVWAECLRVLKPGGVALIFSGTRTFHRLGVQVEDAGFEIRDCLSWLYGQGFPKSLDISKAIDKAAGAEREVVGSKHVTRILDPETLRRGNYTVGARASGGEIPVTAPATDAARAWSGYGTALKPAWEPIVLAMKPCAGTFAANALSQGVAGLNVDGCRVGTEGGMTRHTRKRDGTGPGWHPESTGEVTQHGGRWPANLVLDEEAAAQLDEQSGHQKDGVAVRRRGVTGGQTSIVRPKPAGTPDMGYGGSGGASRFFYCAKASKSDRATGLPADHPGNRHPTVKPVELMRWLVRMVTMPSGTLILDPFSGSGSTGVACALEGVDFVGVEREAEYAELARARIAGVLAERAANNEDGADDA